LKKKSGKEGEEVDAEKKKSIATRLLENE